MADTGYKQEPPEGEGEVVLRLDRTAGDGAVDGVVAAAGAAN